MLDGGDERMRVVEEDGVGFDEALADVLGHARAEGFVDLSAVEGAAEFFDGGDAEFLVDAQDASGVETRVLVDGDNFGGYFGAKFFKTSEFAFENDFADGEGDGFTDAFVGGEIGLVADEFVDAFAKAADGGSGAAVGADFVGVVAFYGEELGERGETVGDFGVTERSGGRHRRVMLLWGSMQD